MNTGDYITDEDLTVYLDGEAAPELAQRITHALRGDGEIEHRLEALRIPLDELRSAMDSLTGQAPAMPPLPSSKGQSRRSGGVIAAGVVVGILLGGVIGYSVPGRVDNDWKAYVAAYQALYVNKTLSDVHISSLQAAAMLGDLSSVLGLDLGSVSNDPVLNFKRAQLLGYNNNPLVQIAYLSPSGEPIALCITLIESRAAEALTVGTMQGMASASWTKDGYGFLVIGGSDETIIRASALRFKAALSG